MKLDNRIQKGKIKVKSYFVKMIFNRLIGLDLKRAVRGFQFSPFIVPMKKLRPREIK